MSSNRVFNRTSCAVALAIAAVAGCNNIVGLDRVSVRDEPSSVGGSIAGGIDSSSAGSSGSGVQNGGDAGVPGGGSDPMSAAGEAGSAPVGDCTTNQQCIDRAMADATGIAGAPAAMNASASVCVKKPAPHCVKLLSEDCDGITGEYANNQAIVLGSLFSTKGATAPTNLLRQQSAALAIEQINSQGGVPAGTSANGRPLVLVSCDASTDLVRAAKHLVSDLHVPAIVGPNTSQDTLDVSTKVTVPGGTVVMSPTGVASSIASLIDNDLTWLMVPSDVQRAPLMINQIGVLEQTLKVTRNKTTIKLGVIFRNDALGIGTRASLNDLVINGKSMTDPVNLNNNVQIDGYSGADATLQPTVSKYVSFMPDIIVLAGTAEAITKIMVPLETQWMGGADRPSYILIDSTKVPELLAAVTNNDDLRRRVRGTGITSGPVGKNTPGDTYNAFVLDYTQRYPGSTPTASGMGPAHDAAYAIGMALAATRNEPVSGANVALGLRKLAGGPTVLEATNTNILPAFQKLAAGERITSIGTFGNLDWDANGAVLGGTLEMWCIGVPAGKPAYASSGLMFDIKSQTRSGAYVQCGQ